MDRLLVAYGLMVVLALGVGATIWWTVHNSHERTYKRRLARERKQREQREQESATAAEGAPDPYARARA
jgi:uncharacterized protein HemX